MTIPNTALPPSNSISAFGEALAIAPAKVTVLLRSLIAAVYDTIEQNRERGVPFDAIVARFNEAFKEALPDPLTAQRLRQLYYAEHKRRTLDAIATASIPDQDAVGVHERHIFGEIGNRP